MELEVRCILPLYSQQLCDLTVGVDMKWGAVLCAICSKFLSLSLLDSVTSWIGDGRISLN